MNATAFQYEEPFTITIASLSVNLILGTPLNGYVMWLILRASRETLASDFFFLNLAISQFFFALSGICYLIFAHFGVLLCLLIFAFSIGLLFTTNPLFQCCICIECYVGVIHPLLYLRFKSLRYKLACCCATWVISLGSCTYYTLTYLEPLFLYANLSGCVLLFCVMIFCCLSVFRALKRPRPGEKDSGKKISNTKKRKAVRIILVIMISTAVTILSYVLAVPLQCCFGYYDFSHILEICLNIAVLTTFIQPLLYLHKSGNLPCMKRV